MAYAIHDKGDAMRDDLTGLANTESARETLDGWQAEARDKGVTAPVHVMILALGRFDAVNLAYGEATGDGALVTVAQRILHFAQDEFEANSWVAARIGGGKFLLAAHEACSRERWQWLAEALADAIAHPIADLNGVGMVRLWPRIALMRPVPGESAALIFDRLAETMEQARTQQSSRVKWADGGLTVPGRRSAMVDAELLSAIDRDEIEVLYQPQVDLRTGEITGAEALARWQHFELGRIGASQLFAIGERTDHVAQLSRHIATKAMQDARNWPDHLRLSINVTPADLSAPSFSRELVALCEASSFDPARLTIEITEHVLLDNLESSAAMLEQLADHGIKIALDDFGAGFCNFRYLKILPLAAIKLDRAMVDGIEDNIRDLAVLRAIIAMARALELSVTVEGVETEEQRAIIRDEGADHFQGFLCAKPMAAEAFLELIG